MNSGGVKDILSSFPLDGATPTLDQPVERNVDLR